MENIPVATKDEPFWRLVTNSVFHGQLRKRTTWSHIMSRLPPSLRIQLFNWPLRSVVLCKGCLYVYKKEGDEKPCSSYSLYGYYKILHLEDISQPPEHEHAFVVKFAQPMAGMDLYFACTDVATRKDWMEKISKEMVRANSCNKDGVFLSADGFPVDTDFGDIDDLYDCITVKDMDPDPPDNSRKKHQAASISGAAKPRADSGGQISHSLKAPSPLYRPSTYFSGGTATLPNQVNRKPVPALAPKKQVARPSSCDEQDYEDCGEFRRDSEHLQGIIENDLFLKAFSTSDVELATLKKRGAFYIRESSKQKSVQNNPSVARFTLCVSADNLTRKFIIRQDESGACLEQQKNNNFKDINELLQFYQKNPLPSAAVVDLKLTLPYRDLCKNSDR